jgi:hypothetical protein
VLCEQLIGRLIYLHITKFVIQFWDCSNNGHFPNVLSKMSNFHVYLAKKVIYYIFLSFICILSILGASNFMYSFNFQET